MGQGHVGAEAIELLLSPASTTSGRTNAERDHAELGAVAREERLEELKLLADAPRPMMGSALLGMHQLRTVPDPHATAVAGSRGGSDYNACVAEQLTESDRAVAMAKEQQRAEDRRTVAAGQVSAREMNLRNFIASEAVHHYRIKKTGRLR